MECFFKHSHLSCFWGKRAVSYRFRVGLVGKWKDKRAGLFQGPVSTPNATGSNLSWVYGENDVRLWA